MSFAFDRDRFAAALLARGLGHADVARLAGIATSTVAAAASGRPVAPGTARRLAAALAKTPELELMATLVGPATNGEATAPQAVASHMEALSARAAPRA